MDEVQRPLLTNTVALRTAPPSARGLVQSPLMRLLSRLPGCR